ncbi:hypothetical protein [Paenisporosarcina sp.]|uniref:hypothetical protein n=1 Tax=Paenisporosarcina sp. TaxID=1932001 RepID=UPI003C77DC77
MLKPHKANEELQKIDPNIKFYFELAEKLRKDEVTIEEYFSERDMTPRTKLVELELLLKDEIRFNLFLDKLTVGSRCIVMKNTFGLSTSQLTKITKVARSTISDFIKDSLVVSQPMEAKRNYNVHLIYYLAIIFDIPYKYLMFNKINDKDNSGFDEYELGESETTVLVDLVQRTKTLKEDLRNGERNIFGARVYNQFFVEEKKYLYTRVDIKERDWIIIEFYISNPLSFSQEALMKLKSTLKEQTKIFIRKAFLRDGYKLVLLITKETSRDIIKEYAYLNKNLML